MAIASFVTMTSVFGSSNFAKAETNENIVEAASVTASSSSIQTHLSATFTAPSSWTNVYAYAYYVENKGSTNEKLMEPLGCWPGTKLTKGTDGKYPIEFESSIGKAKIIYVNVESLGEYKQDSEGKWYYDATILQQLPADDKDPKTEDGYDVVGDVTFNPITAHFSAPASWDNVYAYAYYTDSTKRLQEPLGYWPGTKLEKGTDGKYNVSVISSAGYAKFIYTNVDESSLPDGVMPEPIPKNDGIEGYYYDVKAKAQLPNFDGNTSTEDGYKAEEGENSFTSEIIPTPGPISTVKPSATPTLIPTVTPTLTPTITPTITPTLTPTITPTVTPSAIPTVVPTVIPTVTPSAIPTVIPTVTPSAIPTVTPSTIPTVTPSAIPTVTPSAIPTVTPSAIPTVTPSVIPTVVPTVIPTVTPSAIPTIIPTVTPGVIVVDDIPSDPIVATPSALKGSISFNKTNKTVGETIKIKASAKNGKATYKYTYIVKKGTKKTTLASKTTAKSVNWIPTKAGTYTVSVKITDANKKTVTVTKKYTVKKAVIVVKSFKTSKSSGQKVKTEIVLSANATAKKGKPSYKFAVQLGNGKIKVIKKFSTKKKVTWKPAKKGTYTLYVYVKNGKGITVTKTKTFKIKK